MILLANIEQENLTPLKYIFLFPDSISTFCAPEIKGHFAFISLNSLHIELSSS